MTLLWSYQTEFR